MTVIMALKKRILLSFRSGLMLFMLELSMIRGLESQLCDESKTFKSHFDSFTILVPNEVHFVRKKRFLSFFISQKFVFSTI